MPNDDQEPKPKSVRTRPANVIRAIVLGAAAAAAPVTTGCPTAMYGVPDYGIPDAEHETAGDVTGDEAAHDGIPDGIEPDSAGDVAHEVPDAVPPYGLPDGAEPDAVPPYGLPDGAEPDATVDDVVSDSGDEVVPPYGVPDYGTPDYGTPDYGTPDGEKK